MYSSTQKRKQHHILKVTVAVVFGEFIHFPSVSIFLEYHLFSPHFGMSFVLLLTSSSPV